MIMIWVIKKTLANPRAKYVKNTILGKSITTSNKWKNHYVFDTIIIVHVAVKINTPPSAKYAIMFMLLPVELTETNFTNYYLEEFW